jgi:N-hydroxyarylamine O-acetyltransferase
MCHHHQTSPESSFTQSQICSRATADGRITVAGMKFIITRNGHREEREVDSAERDQILRDQFGISL